MRCEKSSIQINVNLLQDEYGQNDFFATSVAHVIYLINLSYSDYLATCSVLTLIFLTF